MNITIYQELKVHIRRLINDPHRSCRPPTSVLILLRGLVWDGRLKCFAVPLILSVGPSYAGPLSPMSWGTSH